MSVKETRLNNRPALFYYNFEGGKKKQRAGGEEYHDNQWISFQQFCDFLQNMNPGSDIRFQLVIYLPFLHLYPLQVESLAILLDQHENLLLDKEYTITSEFLTMNYSYMVVPICYSTSVSAKLVFQQVNHLYFHACK